jgi:hypothetical protein
VASPVFKTGSVADLIALPANARSWPGERWKRESNPPAGLCRRPLTSNQVGLPMPDSTNMHREGIEPPQPEGRPGYGRVNSPVFSLCVTGYSLVNLDQPEGTGFEPASP